MEELLVVPVGAVFELEPFPHGLTTFAVALFLLSRIADPSGCIHIGIVARVLAPRGCALCIGINVVRCFSSNGVGVVHGRC